MESASTTAGSATATRAVQLKWRIWALVPILALVAAASTFAAAGGSLIGLIGTNPPPADEFDIRRVELKEGEIRVRVTNPQRSTSAPAATLETSKKP